MLIREDVNSKMSALDEPVPEMILDSLLKFPAGACAQRALTIVLKPDAFPYHQVGLPAVSKRGRTHRLVGGRLGPQAAWLGRLHLGHPALVLDLRSVKHYVNGDS